ncbi:hypothetical protein PC122_g24161, partial [Phytophthora cactorum]
LLADYGDEKGSYGSENELVDETSNNILDKH